MNAIKSVFAVLLLAVAGAAFANPPAFSTDPSTWYSVTKAAPGETAPGNANILVESSQGTFFGALLSEPAQLMPAGTTSMGMRFEFYTDNYFTQGNQGHIAIGLRGDGYNGLLGRGIVIGNVTGLAGESATTHPASIAIESFWADGNAVYGKHTESTGLENETHYRVTVVSSGANAEVIAYTLEKKYDTNWVKVAHREIVDFKGLNKISPQLGGWFAVEVFSQHAWNYQLRNLVTWYE